MQLVNNCRQAIPSDFSTYHQYSVFAMLNIASPTYRLQYHNVYVIISKNMLYWLIRGPIFSIFSHIELCSARPRPSKVFIFHIICYWMLFDAPTTYLILHCQIPFNTLPMCELKCRYLKKSFIMNAPLRVEHLNHHFLVGLLCCTHQKVMNRCSTHKGAFIINDNLKNPHFRDRTLY